MKKLLVVLIMLVFWPAVMAQEVMQIRKTDGTTVTVPVEEIRDITFSGTAVVSPGDTVTDIDGNVYATVTIGDQVWMTENLRTTRFRDGSSIPHVTNLQDWVDRETPAFTWYDNDASNKEPYGALYNFHAVATNRLCPEGWHVPTAGEWSEMTDLLGGNRKAGGKLKNAGTSHWRPPNRGATNESGFNGLPGGMLTYSRSDGARFSGYGESGYWWTSNRFHRGLSYRAENVQSTIHSGTTLGRGYSVRCIRD